MKIKETLKLVIEKYKLDFDTNYYNKEKNISYYSLSNDIVKESLFLNTLISRNKQGIVSYYVAPKLPLNFWDLFEKYIKYYSSSEYYIKDLENTLLLCSFMDKFFYVDMSWKKDNAIILEKLVEDEDLIKLIKYYTGFEMKTILRETSYYYDNEVWDIVKKYFAN